MPLYVVYAVLAGIAWGVGGYFEKTPGGSGELIMWSGQMIFFLSFNIPYEGQENTLCENNFGNFYWVMVRSAKKRSSCAFEVGRKIRGDGPIRFKITNIWL